MNVPFSRTNESYTYNASAYVIHFRQNIILPFSSRTMINSVRDNSYHIICKLLFSGINVSERDFSCSSENRECEIVSEEGDVATRKASVNASASPASRFPSTTLIIPEPYD